MEMIGPLPASLEAEQQLLSALLVTDEEMVLDPMSDHIEEVFGVVEKEDFALPFHAWLFDQIREARRTWKTLDKIVKFLIAPCQQRAAKGFGVKNLPFELASMFLCRDGSSCSGEAKYIRLYVNHLRRIRFYREQVDRAEREVSRAYEQWHEVVASNQHRICGLDKPGN